MPWRSPRWSCARAESLPCSCFPLRLAVGAVAGEAARRRELAELVADHVLGHQHGQELLAVVHAKRQTHELRQDGGAPRPGLDHFIAARTTRSFRLLQEVAINERAFPNRASHRAISLLARVTTAQDLAVGLLVVTRLLALGRDAPGRDPVHAAVGAAAVRVVDRVHGDAAGRRADAQPARAARLAEDGVLVVRVADGADGRHALGLHHAHFARGHAQQRAALVAADELDERAGGAGHLAALAGLQLDIVHDRADRDVFQRHRVARLHVDALAGDDHVARLQALRRQDIAELAVLVLHQRDEGRAVRIVLQALDRRRHVELAALEVDQAIPALVAAALAERGQTTVVVAPAALLQALGQFLDRLALVQVRTVDDDDVADTGGGRLKCLQSHRLHSRRDVDGLALGQSHDCLLGVVALADKAAEPLDLALAAQGVDGSHLHLEHALDRRLDLRLGRLERNPERDLVVLRSQRALLGHHRPADDVVHLRLAQVHHRLVHRSCAAHFSRSTKCSIAPLVRTRVSRRRMSYTFAPCCGSTSTFGMLRAALANCSFTSGPSMTRTEAQPSFLNWAASSLVLPLAEVSPHTTSLPSLCLALRAFFSASLRTFFGRSCAWLRTTGPKMVAPPRNCGERSEPWRALPVPFWAYGFLVVPEMSPISLVLWLPDRRLASCQLTARARMSLRTVRPKISANTASSISTSPTALLLMSVTFSSMTARPCP